MPGGGGEVKDIRQLRPFTPAESNPGRDRRDDLVAESAATVATWFSRVVVYEDRDLRGREAARWPG